MHQAFSEKPQCISVCRGVLLLASVQPDNQSMTNLDTQSSIIEFMAGPSTTSSEMSDETQRVMMQRQDALAANHQEILWQLNQNGRSQRGSPIELDVAPDSRGASCLGGKTERASGLKKEMGG
ncbi:hypothetical protein UPYG_G00180250 [Umbra pygmaea]|uniref:Uncharacterized protein n=1 Tax=Umbra pygmaea TaxID=75934 RepID=A0ABD0WQG0_UMBPY